MVAQLQPREESVEKPQAIRPVPRAHPHPKFTKKRIGADKRRARLAGWMKWVGSSVGLIATIVATLAAVRQLNPPPPPPPPSAAPTVKVDGRATLIRKPKNKQHELRVSLTLLNEGGSVALIPRPTVSLGDAPIPLNDLHFTFAEGTSEVIFPVSLHEGASTFERKIICSIAEGRDSHWYQTRLLRLNLDFKPEGHDPISHCLMVIPPLTEGHQPLSSDESTCFTITDDCDAFGDGLTKRPFTKRTS
jgi:hypothetical protein